ncbi:MAG TPA: NUDIX hydrolase [Epsilonproteobacteria bacterium]|nr:NUDIX hydrolase [Campylobacterota bacterium]
MDVEIDRVLGIYSDPDRDPRFHVATIVYVAKASGQPKGGDDAMEANLYALIDLPLDKLVFDHRVIVEDYLKTCN